MSKYMFTDDQIDAMTSNPRLTDRERNATTLFYRRGWAIEDVAAEMGYSRRTVDTLLRNARNKM